MLNAIKVKEILTYIFDNTMLEQINLGDTVEQDKTAYYKVTAKIARNNKYPIARIYYKYPKSDGTQYRVVSLRYKGKRHFKTKDFDK